MDEEIQVTAQPRPKGYSEIPDWITEATSHAYKLYGVLRGYADNRTRRAWPSLATLASRMKFAKPDTVIPYIKELEAMGAIRVTRSKAENKVKNVNIYHVLWDQPGGTPVEGGTPENSRGGTPVGGGRGTPVERGRGTPSERDRTTPTELHPTELPLFPEPADAEPGESSDQPVEVLKEKTPGGVTQELVGIWLEHCPTRPPGRVVGQVAKEITIMLSEGIEYRYVLAGLERWHSRHLHPSTLPSMVHEASLDMNAPSAMPQTAPPARGGTPRVATADRNIQDTLSLLSPEYRAQMEAGMNRPAGELEA
ncbi:HTH DNA binding domain protein [Arthrobacter phage Shrooms]|nr:HTH DNA binding domain protein [Arthrobacter phage Shrooms]